MQRWEYLEVNLWRDPQKTAAPAVQVAGPSDEGYRKLDVPGSDGAHWLDVLNDLGDSGWELVGPPTEVKVALTYKNDAGAWMNCADWREKSYLLKRVRE